MEVDQSLAIEQLLAKQRDEHTPPELQPYFLQFQEFWERRLWHQLTECLVQYFDEAPEGPQRLFLFKNFVLTFADKINQLQLVSLALSAASQIQDRKEALEFLQTVAKKVNNPDSQDAYVYAIVEVAMIQLSLRQFEESRSSLDEAEKILDTFDAVESVVHASFYRTSADYYSAKLEFAPYYKNALLYLACIELEEMSLPEQQRRARDLAIAALLGENIYNFGELLLHPILNTLQGTPEAWLRELLFAFNAGDLAKYNSLLPNFEKNELLHGQQAKLREKICLSALTEAVFRRPPHDRAMTFATIHQETRVDPAEIEFMLMRALSLGLLKGKIDQVAEVARISWVQPKVLDKNQVEGMRQRLMEWDGSVSKLAKWMEEKMAMPANAEALVAGVR